MFGIVCVCSLLMETGPLAPSGWGIVFCLVTEDLVLDLGCPDILREPFRFPLPFRSVLYEMTRLFLPLLDSFRLELCCFTGLELPSDWFLIVA